MSLLLEKIIRQILLEQRAVAKLKDMPDAEWQKAKAEGAVMAFQVVVRGTSDTKAIKRLVQSVITASTGAETDTKISIGADSRFATQPSKYDPDRPKYCYVMNDPLPKKRQIITVWVMEMPILKSAESAGDEINVKGYAQFRIGKTGLETVSEYNKTYTNLKNEKLLISDFKPLTNLKSKEDTESDVDVNKKSIDTTEKPADKKVVDSPLKSDTEQGLTYPYEIVSVDGKVISTVYSIPGSDYVYVYGGNVWHFMNKKDFEYQQSLPADKRLNIDVSQELTDPALIDTLNQMSGKKVSIPKKQDSTSSNKEQPKKPEEKKKEEPKPKKPEEKKKEERKFTENQKISLKATSVYKRVSSKFEKITKYEVGKETILYKETSADKKYVRVLFKTYFDQNPTAKGKDNTWVPIESIK
jgi:hypothetical protein